MSVEILVKGDAHRKVLEEVVHWWYQLNPEEVRETAEYLKEWRKSLVNEKTGKWKEEGNGYVKCAYPATLFHLMRKVWHELTGEEWGRDDAQVLEAARLFPDLIPNTLRKPNG